MANKKEKKISKVMREFKNKKLNIGKSKKKVKNRKQAIAIALSEAGVKKKKERPEHGRNRGQKRKEKHQCNETGEWTPSNIFERHPSEPRATMFGDGRHGLASVCHWCANEDRAVRARLTRENPKLDFCPCGAEATQLHHCHETNRFVGHRTAAVARPPA